MLKVLKLGLIKSLRSIKSAKPNSNWKLNNLEVFKLIGFRGWKVLTVSLRSGNVLGNWLAKRQLSVKSYFEVTNDS